MRPDEIRRAIELPARHVGLYAEPALADAIVSDVEDQPGALPLLSTSLVEVWQRRSGATLTAVAYHQAGGVSGAVARLGEAAYASLDRLTREAARRLLLRLAETDESGSVVRRRVPRAELGADPATARALDVFVGRRLLTASERGVEVTHESVLTYWPRLAAWLADDEQGRTLRRHMAPAALEWENAGRPDAELYRGARLASALDWADERLADLTDLERDFLDASKQYGDRELQDEIARAGRLTRGRRRLRAALASAVVLLLVASVAGVVALDRQLAAEQASRESLARRLAALALATPDLDRSLLLAVQAVRTHEDWETRGALLDRLNRSPHALRQVRGRSDQGVIVDVAMTRDGSTLVAVAGGGTVYSWDTGTLAPTAPPADPAANTIAVTPGPDARSVFISAQLDRNHAAVIHWDTIESRELNTYPIPEGVLSSDRHLALSADDQSLAVPTQGHLLLLYEVSTGRLLSRVELPETPGDVWPAGSLMVTAAVNGDTAYFVDPRSGAVRMLPLPFAGNVAASPDGQALLVVSGARAALVAADTGQVIREFSGATDSAAVAAFSGNGDLVAVGGKDQLIGVWDLDTGELRDTLSGHSAPIRRLVFGADVRTLYSTSEDHSVIAWDVTGARSFPSRGSRAPVLEASRSATRGPGTISPPVVDWSADRRQVYVNAADGSGAAVIDVQTGRPEGSVTPFFIDPNDAQPIADLDQKMIFLTAPDGSVVRRDLASATGVQTTSTPEPPLTRYGVAVSGDGRTLATPVSNLDDEKAATGAEIFDSATLDLRSQLSMDFPVSSVWLNGDGSLLVTVRDGPDLNYVEVWDTRTGGRRWITDTELRAAVSSVAWSPGGKTLFVVSIRGDVIALDLSTGEPLAQHAQLRPSVILSIEVSPSGEFVALGGRDRQVHLLAADRLREIGLLPMPAGAEWTFVAFDPDSAGMSAVDERGRVVWWDINAQHWVERACEVAGRDLSPIEWERFLPGVAYERTCPGLG